MKKVLFLPVLLLAALSGCKDSKSNDNLLLLKQELVSNAMKKEFDLLCSESELNILSSRSIETTEGIVDWTLAKEFAELTLQSFIQDGEFSENAYLWKYPLCIYSEDGSIRYYEFRVLENEQIVAAIACNAQEKYGPPVDKIFKTDGYLSELEKLFDKEVLSENDLPRIVDNVYPSHVISISEQTRSGEILTEKLINPESGTEVEEVDKLLTVEETFEIYPDLYTDEQKQLALVEIGNYKGELENLWECAKERKGEIIKDDTRGNLGYKYRVLPDLLLLNTYAYHLNNMGEACTAVGYGACGASAVGFILDYLDANNLGVATNWQIIDNPYKKEEEPEKYYYFYKQARINWLNRLLSVNSIGITWPENLGNPLNLLTIYKLNYNLGFWPKESIDRNLPGISLRTLNLSNWSSLQGGFHYRNVIGYKQDGFWIFTWKYIKVLDGNRVDTNNINGTWEAQIPLYQIAVFNTARR